MKTSELTGAALDWAVCAALEAQFGEQRIVKICRQEATFPAWIERENSVGAYTYHRFSPSTDWSQGGPIIERERIELLRSGDECCAQAGSSVGAVADGKTPLLAAMRCYVASKLGDEIDIPKELM